jgi:hypothetical protein
MAYATYSFVNMIMALSIGLAHLEHECHHLCCYANEDTLQFAYHQYNISKH